MKNRPHSHSSFRSTNHSNHLSRQAWGNPLPQKGFRAMLVSARFHIWRVGGPPNSLGPSRGQGISTHSIPRGGFAVPAHPSKAAFLIWS